MKLIIKNLIYIVLIGLSSTFTLNAQNHALKGKVINNLTKEKLAGATVIVLSPYTLTNTDSEGNFSFILKPGIYKIQVSFIGFKPKEIETHIKQSDITILVGLDPTSYTFTDIDINDIRDRNNGVVSINPKLSTTLPNPSGNFETILQSFGARITSEFSSQYNVRGGNFDENLVYINDFEIYRPVLMRSGQQEGMSIINPQMVGNIRFSAGGFEARYGDKMSSVLDIRYKRPDSNKTFFTGGIMGGQLNHEHKWGKWSLLFGARYRTLSNLLNSLDTRGEYKPSFADFQSLITYKPSSKWEYNFFNYFANNRYEVVPVDRETTFGTVQEALLLKVFFQGREITGFKTYTSGFSANYLPNPRTSLKFLAYGYHSNEKESFDVEGAYRLDQLETDLGSSQFGKVAFNRGIGGVQNWARNQLTTWVGNLEHKGLYTNTKGNTLEWGVRLQHDQINDKLYEWVAIDSAGFLVPQAGTDSTVVLEQLINAQNRVVSNRLMAYAQHAWLLDVEKDFNITAGIRSQYWSFSREWLISPRAQMSFRPFRKKDVVFRFQTGIYQQPTFYREMRNLFGVVNNNIKAQKSAQTVAGLDKVFKSGNRSFKVVSEVWYKYMWDVIPYEIDNVRVRYLAQNNAIAYATGIDLRINGEFVKSLESWASVSYLRTFENILNDSYIDKNGVTQYPGWIPRPTDQRVMFTIMFQDYLPMNPSYKVNLNLVYATGLPFGPPDNQRYKDTFRMPPYRRVDIGFSKQIVGKGARNTNSALLNQFKSLWASIEVFNLLQVNNTISYLWVRDSQENQYAVPNYLSARILNFRVVAEF